MWPEIRRIELMHKMDGTEARIYVFESARMRIRAVNDAKIDGAGGLQHLLRADFAVLKQLSLQKPLPGSQTLMPRLLGVCSPSFTLANGKVRFEPRQLPRVTLLMALMRLVLPRRRCGSAHFDDFRNYVYGFLGTRSFWIAPLLQKCLRSSLSLRVSQCPGSISTNSSARRPCVGIVVHLEDQVHYFLKKRYRRTN